MGKKMVGGKIYSIDRLRFQNTAVIVQGIGPESSEYLEVELICQEYPLAVGDSLWWQGKYAYWTPADRQVQDVPICKIGESARIPVE